MSTKTTTKTKTVAEIEADLTAARQVETDRITAEIDRRETAQVEFARQRLAAYDSGALSREAQQATGKIESAIAADPVFAAMINAKAAEWRAHRAAHAAVRDRQVIARAEGHHEPVRPYDGPAPSSLDPAAIVARLASLLLHEQMDAEQETEQDAEREALSTTLTDEQVNAVEAERDLARRRAEVERNSIDVTGMSDAERAEHGLPSGRSTYPDTGGFRAIIGG